MENGETDKMKAEATMEEGTLIIKVRGQVNTGTAAVFEQCISNKFLELEKKKEEDIENAVQDIVNVVLDLTDTEYISSAGLRVVLRVYKKVNDRGGKLVVRGANETIREVFHITGFDRQMVME